MSCAGIPTTLVRGVVKASLDREDESWGHLNCEMAFKRLFLFNLNNLT